MQRIDPNEAMPDFPWDALERAHAQIEQLFQPKGTNEALLRRWEKAHEMEGLRVVDQTFVDHTRNLIGMLQAKKFIPHDPARACAGFVKRVDDALAAADKFQHVLRAEPITEDAAELDALIEQLRAPIVEVRHCVAPYVAERTDWQQRVTSTQDASTSTGMPLSKR